MLRLGGLVLLAALAPACKPAASAPDGGADAGPEACEPVEVTERFVDPAARKFAVPVFHYNIQYVAGGLAGGEGYGSFCGADCDAWDNRAVEDWIVVETFEPVVDFYLENPQWNVTLEMQAYMLEVLAERFPAVVDKLRTLVERDQAEVVSFHYADQLFLAYPARDQVRSVALTRALFEAQCLPLSTAVFNQEGQAGEGWIDFLSTQGYEVAIFPKNLWRYARGEALRWPWYQRGTAKVVVGPGAVDPASGIEVTWPFFDDGELLAVTGDLNPYFAPFVGFDPARLEEYGARLAALDAAGFKSEHVTGYVRHLERLRVAARPLPPLLDGTWQAPSTDSIHRWLGGRGEGTWWTQERDNEVRAGNYRARTLLEAAEILDQAAGGRATAELGAMWKTMLHAEVSDASGVNPWAGEVSWSLERNAEVIAFSEALIAERKGALGHAFVSIDLATGEVAGLAAIPEVILTELAVPPLPGVVVDAPGRAVAVAWHAVETGRSRLTVTAGPGTGTDHRLVSVRFPRSGNLLAYSPGLTDDVLVQRDLSDYNLLEGQAYLPLANGLIGLGADRWVVKHTRVVHVAARVPAAEATIDFIDETPPWETEVTWVFEVVEGTIATALAVARELNIAPVVYR